MFMSLRLILLPDTTASYLPETVRGHRPEAGYTTLSREMCVLTGRKYALFPYNLRIPTCDCILFKSQSGTIEVLSGKDSARRCGREAWR